MTYKKELIRSMNYLSKNPKTIKETWEIISLILNVEIKNINANLSKMEMRSYTSDYRKFSRDANWYPQISLEEGLLDTIKNIRNYE